MLALVVLIAAALIVPTAVTLLAVLCFKLVPRA